MIVVMKIVATSGRIGLKLGGDSQTSEQFVFERPVRKSQERLGCEKGNGTSGQVSASIVGVHRSGEAGGCTAVFSAGERVESERMISFRKAVSGYIGRALECGDDARVRSLVRRMRAIVERGGH
jgi:hypothetical protein